MKRFSCIGIRSLGIGIGTIDILCSLIILIVCSHQLYYDIVQFSNWPQNEIQIMNPLSNLITSLVDYVFVHNFSNAFYMIVAITIWVKSFINLVVASILIDGIRKARIYSVASWVINTTVSMLIEITIFIFMEIKIDEIDASLDRRIARSILFGIFIVLNTLFTFAIFAVYKTFKVSLNENRILQESIAETSAMFQHIKV